MAAASSATAGPLRGPAAQGAASIGVSLLGASELCALARRIPRPKRTGNLIDDSAAEQEFNALTFVVDHLQKNPRFIMPIHGHLLTLIKTDAQKVHDDHFPAISVLGRLPEDFLVRWLDDRTGLSLSELAKVKAADPEGIRRLCCHLLQLPTGARLPAAMVHKSVATKALTLRCIEAGERGKAWGKHRLTPEGALNWSHGSYKLNFQNNRAATITHCLGDVAKLPDHVVVTTAFSLLDNHCDWSARVARGGTEHKLAAFFEKPTGPHKRPQYHAKTKPLFGPAAKAEKVVEAAKATLGARSGSAGSYAQAMAEGASEKRKAAASRARTALQSRQENLQKRRRVTLGAV